MTAMTPTASTFREALLRSLGTATGLQSDTPVKMKDVLPLVYSDAGIAEDAHGKDVNGWFKVRLWVQQCYKTLRRQDLAIKAGRGNWGLSTEGIKVTATLLGVPVPAQTIATPAITRVATAENINLDDLLEEFTSLDTLEDLATITDPGSNGTEEASPDAHEGGEGVAYSLGTQTNTYNSDPYLRGLAIESTTCFGEFSRRSAVCKGCPLSGACKATVLSEISGIAAKLRKRDVESIRLAAMPATPPKNDDSDDDIDDIIADIEGVIGTPKPASSTGSKLKIAADAKCRGCTQKVDRGTEAMYVRGVGIYHTECYTKKVGTP